MHKLCSPWLLKMGYIGRCGTLATIHKINRTLKENGRNWGTNEQSIYTTMQETHAHGVPERNEFMNGRVETMTSFTTHCLPLAMQTVCMCYLIGRERDALTGARTHTHTPKASWARPFPVPEKVLATPNRTKPSQIVHVESASARYAHTYVCHCLPCHKTGARETYRIFAKTVAARVTRGAAQQYFSSCYSICSLYFWHSSCIFVYPHLKHIHGRWSILEGKLRWR